MNDILKSYPSVECEARSYLVNNVYIAHNRAIFNEDWTINLEASHHYLYWDCNFRSRNHAEKGINFEQRCTQIIKECQNKKIEHLPEDFFALCTHFNNGYPFGNWYETIASLRFIEEDNFKILANKSNHPGVSDIELHFELAGFSSDRIYYYDKNTTTPFAKSLYSPTIDRYIGATNAEKKHLDHTQKTWRNQRFQWIRNRYLNHPKVVSVLDNIPRKLYLSRNYLNSRNANYNRKVLNEELEIIPYLQDKGFTIVRGDEPLLNIINYFYSASDIVFPHGSLIHNAIFCNNKPRIIEFMSEFRQRNHFYLLFDDLSGDYDMIISKADNDQNNNIIIDMKKLKETYQ